MLGQVGATPGDRLRMSEKDKRRARRKARLCARADGYDLHAAPRIAAVLRVSATRTRVFENSTPAARSARRPVSKSHDSVFGGGSLGAARLVQPGPPKPKTRGTAAANGAPAE